MDVLNQRQEYASQRLSTLRESIADISELNGLNDLCIYATGSYGRLEASANSDLDLFFLRKGEERNNKVPAIAKTLIDADLIRICRSQSLPEFSGDGRYLEVHYLDDIKHALGGPEDDAKNFFTARLLLLLESQPVHNEAVYHAILLEVIKTYYRDYPHHSREFNNRFLMNDILRFWKTLCLNYEQRRNRFYVKGTTELSSEDKLKSQLKNLKLKFSRMLTCFSTVAYLSRNPSVAAETFMDAVKKPPLERLALAVEDRDGGDTYVRIRQEYGWFLEQTGNDEDEVLEWISEDNRREEAFRRAREFGDTLYEALRLAISENPAEQHTALRYLVI